MKKEFFDILFRHMSNINDIYFVSAGLGWPRTDDAKRLFPDRYIQCEASEQTALDICVGLAYSGKIPVMYTITPFLYRGFETIRTYINHERLNVKLIGAGRDDDYSKHDGFSHDASDIEGLFNCGDERCTEHHGFFNHIKPYWPHTNDDLSSMMSDMLYNGKPTFLSLRR